MKKIVLLILIYFSYILLGLALTNRSIPNQEGYFELSWNFSYIDFKKTLLSPAVTPLNFFVAHLIHVLTKISLSNAWKVMDLSASGGIVVFLIHIYWTKNKSKNLVFMLLPPLIIFSSIGFIYSFTSMSGEGMTILFAMLGVYNWQNKKFLTATFLFSLSFLAKYTIYLIGPGIIIWTLLNIKSYSKSEIRKIVIAGTFFLILFFTYHYLKNFGDFKLHTQYINDLTGKAIITNFPYYFFAISLGAPIIAIFSYLNPNFRNIYFLCALSALIMLLRRYFYWNHPQQVISFLMLYFFSHPKSISWIKSKYAFLQLIFSISLLLIMPLISRENPIFYKHMTTTESFKIDNEIYRDYHSGKIGYYLNRRFDEQFPNYEISYSGPEIDSIIRQTEYIVIPTFLGMPDYLKRLNQCRYFYQNQIGLNTIYKVVCR